MIALAALAGRLRLHAASSFTGFQMRVAGQAEAAARYAGFSAKGMVWIGLLVGGASPESPAWAKCPGRWDSSPTSLDRLRLRRDHRRLCRPVNPVGIFFASLLMALLYLGGEQAQQYLNLPSSISKVFQGMLLFFLLGSDVLIQYRVRWSGASKPYRH